MLRLFFTKSNTQDVSRAKDEEWSRRGQDEDDQTVGNVSRQSDGMGLLIDGLRKATVTQIYLATEHMRTGTSRSVPGYF